MGMNIKKIAEIAKVSPATVSLALNDRPGISPITREKILQIAESLRKENDRKKVFHRNLKGSVRFLKIIKHGRIVNRDHDVFIASYIDGLDSEAHTHGYRLELTNLAAGEIPDFIGHLTGVKIEGLIVLGTELSHGDLQAFETLDMPVVVIDTSYDFLKLDFVDMNNEEAVFQIIRYFRENNHREIGLIRSDVEARNIELRYKFFPHALKHHGLPYNSDYVYTVDSTYNGAYQGLMQIIRKGKRMPTAIFSANDLMASACMKAFRECGIRVPDDVSIIGFDNLPLSEMLDPPLTTMNVSKTQIGRWAMKLIVDRYSNVSRPAVKCSVGGTLVIRNSVKKLESPP
jgi:DNA-binding LacI/PurR family transcriptional regulator